MLFDLRYLSHYLVGVSVHGGGFGEKRYRFAPPQWENAG